MHRHLQEALDRDILMREPVGDGRDDTGPILHEETQIVAATLSGRRARCGGELAEWFAERKSGAAFREIDEIGRHGGSSRASASTTTDDGKVPGWLRGNNQRAERSADARGRLIVCEAGRAKVHVNADI